jgi:hypothetical protein
MSVATERPAGSAKEDNTIVESSYSATVNAPIEKVDIPSWCFTLPESTMVKDATASRSEEEMHAALEVAIPNYANAIVTTREVVKAIASVSDAAPDELRVAVR